jgi:hypothetical protein
MYKRKKINMFFFKWFARPHTYNRGFSVHHKCSGHNLASTVFREESAEAVVFVWIFFRQPSIFTDAMFQAIQFPSGVAQLYSGLANMN